jgi:hypothetical protein
MKCQHIRRFLVALACGWALAGAGCASLHGKRGADPQALAADAQERATCTLELRPSGRKSQQRELALADVQTLQQALEAGGAISRFRNMEVYVLRQLPDGSQRRHKLAARFDRAQRSVSIETDYALHPGDQIVAAEVTTTALEEMAGSLVKPLGRLLSR